MKFLRDMIARKSSRPEEDVAPLAPLHETAQSRAEAAVAALRVNGMAPVAQPPADPFPTDPFRRAEPAATRIMMPPQPREAPYSLDRSLQITDEAYQEADEEDEDGDEALAQAEVEAEVEIALAAAAHDRAEPPAIPLMADSPETGTPDTDPRHSDETGGTNAAAVSIWDLEEEDEPAALTPMQPPAAAASLGVEDDNTAAPILRPGRRPGRTKTRLLGFEHTSSSVVDLFDDKTRQGSQGQVRFPVGWVVVIEGPGRGESFALLSGLSQIGRGEDQAIQLDFGDTTISRTNHAAIAYDPETHRFLLGHGGKSNLVRLNGKPLLSTEEIPDGSKIVIGESTLMVRTLCGPGFNWASSTSKGSDHVASA